jgi:predicted amidohydrolase YtcJ
MDGGCGRIAVGEPADLVVLDHDPSLGGSRLDEARVLGTFRAGVALFASDELLDRAGGGRLSNAVGGA